MTTPFESPHQLLLPCPAQHTATLAKTTPHLATPSPSPPHLVPSRSDAAQHSHIATASSVVPPAIQLEPELSSFVQAKSVANENTNNRVLGVRSTLPSPDTTPERDSLNQQQEGVLDGGANCCKNVCTDSRSGVAVPQSQGRVDGCALDEREGMKGRLEMDCDEVEESQNYTPAAAEAVRSSASSSSKDRFVNGLVGASVLAIDSIWGPPTHTHSTASSHETSVLPLHWFVKEVLRRSRTSCSTLQVALYYLHQSRRDIRTLVAQSLVEREELRDVEERIARFAEGEGEDYPTPPSSPTELHTPHSPTPSASTTAQQNSQPHQQSQISLANRHAALLKSLSNPLLCGRRIFLASLISASKFLQDRNYSNRAWAKISGLTVGEINRNERAFLGLVGYGLFVGAREFGCWTNRLASISLPIETTENQVPPTAYPHPPTATPLTTTTAMAESTSNGARISMTRSTSTPALKTLLSSTPITVVPRPTLPTPAISPPPITRTTSTQIGNRPELSRQRSMKPLPKRLARSTSVSTGAANGAGISWGIMEIDGPSGVVKFSDADRIVGPKKEEGERAVVVV